MPDELIKCCLHQFGGYYVCCFCGYSHATYTPNEWGSIGGHGRHDPWRQVMCEQIEPCWYHQHVYNSINYCIGLLAEEALCLTA